MPCDIFVFAGEKSADLHGEKLLLALRAKNPKLKISGVGGPRMRAVGMHSVLKMEDFQVMGFIDVFRALPKLIRQFYFIADHIQKLKPKAVIMIDYPGFNLRMAKHLKKKGFKGKLIHFICPSVWAWGKKRIPLMAENLDLLLSILPFEKKIFADTPLRVAFVGHPLSERIKNYPYKKPSLPSEKKIIALFPGSRKKEIDRNLGLQLDACRQLLLERSDLHIALSVSDERFLHEIQRILREKDWDESHLSLVPAEHSYELMQCAYFAIAKSGTVTLELAMHRVPTVVVYGVSRLDKIIAYDILRIRLPFYCLVNIIAQKEVFPELIGPSFSLENLLRKAKELLNEPARSTIYSACGEIVRELSGRDTSKEAAAEILKTF